jgi:hypothetical protein
VSTTATGGATLSIDTSDALEWVGILAALASAAVHLLLGVRMLPSGLGVSFVLAGLGFLGAIALVLYDVRRRTVYAVGISVTLVQIGLWYALNFAGSGRSFPADVGTLGIVDNVAQVVLILVLVALLRR